MDELSALPPGAQAAAAGWHAYLANLDTAIPVTVHIGDQATFHGVLANAGLTAREGRDRVLVELVVHRCTCLPADYDPDCLHHFPPAVTDEETARLLPAARNAMGWACGRYVPGQQRSDGPLVNVVAAVLAELRKPGYGNQRPDGTCREPA